MAAPLSLAQRCAKRRDELIQTQKEAAKACGISLRSYWAIESGKNKKPAARVRRRIELWLGEAA